MNYRLLMDLTLVFELEANDNKSRIGDTIDQSQPFRRIRPPKGGTRMGKRRPKLPKS